MPSPIRDAIIRALNATYAHVAPAEALEDLTAAQARERPHPKLATIWEQLAHIVYWQDIFLARMRGETPSYPETAAEGWPPMGESDSDWELLCRRFADGLQAAIHVVETGDLERAVLTDSERTVGDQLTAMATHNSYHVGQIVTLRRMLGLWPPPSGGDTW